MNMVEAQAARPTGMFGQVFGHAMAVFNDEMTTVAVEHLAPSADDRVLEVGFGPGRSLELLARAAPGARLAGVDVSPTMVQQASRRVRRRMPAAPVDLHLGRAESLPFPDSTFTKALAVNTVEFWHELDGGLMELYRVLSPGGVLVLGLRQAPPKAGLFHPPGHDGEDIQRILEAASAVGFQGIRRHDHSLSRQQMTAIVACR